MGRGGGDSLARGTGGRPHGYSPKVFFSCKLGQCVCGQNGNKMKAVLCRFHVILKEVFSADQRERDDFLHRRSFIHITWVPDFEAGQDEQQLVDWGVDQGVWLHISRVNLVPYYICVQEMYDATADEAELANGRGDEIALTVSILHERKHIDMMGSERLARRLFSLPQPWGRRRARAARARARASRARRAPNPPQHPQGPEARVRPIKSPPPQDPRGQEARAT